VKEKVERKKKRLIIGLVIFFIVIGSLGFMQLSGLYLVVGGDGGGDGGDDVYIPPGEVPTNPSIIINQGATSTDKFEINLELSCDYAAQMRIRLDFDGGWGAWERYTTLKTVILPDTSIDYPDYRISVQFRNAYGVSEEVYYDITVHIETPIPSPTIPTEPSETVVKPIIETYQIIGIVVAVVLVGTIVIIQKLRKKARRKN